MDSTQNVVLPANGGIGQGSIQLRVAARSPFSYESREATLPFRFQFLPSVLKLDAIQGTAPATIDVTAQLDSLPPGGIDVEQMQVTSLLSAQNVVVLITRPGPAPLVSVSTLRLSAYLPNSPITGTFQVSPPDNSAFSISSSSNRLVVSPVSGTGPMKITVTADLTRYSPGTTTETLTIQFANTSAKVNVVVNLLQPQELSNSISINGGSVVPGLRATADLSSVSGLPSGGDSWTERSPAPTEWNGYSFVYRSQKLAIVSVDANLLLVTLQFPYDLGPPAISQMLSLVGPDGKVVLGTQLFREEASYLRLLNPMPTVAQAQVVHVGDVIRLSVVGAGTTTPSVPAGQLPGNGFIAIPNILIRAGISGKDAVFSDKRFRLP